MYKTVIFDLDGTLLDTSTDIMQVLNGVLQHFGIEKITAEQTISYIGNGARELVRRAIGEDNACRLDEINDFYVREFAKSDNEHAALYEGEDEALRAFSAAGINLAIVTNKPQAAAAHVCGLFFSGYGFGFVQGQKEGVRLKPAPDAVLAAIEHFGADKADCLFVGDGETDVLTAKNAGIDGVSVLWGYRTKAQLAAVGAVRFVHSFKELEKLVLGD